MSNLQVVVELIDKMTGPLTKLTGVVGDFAKGVQDGAKAELELQKNGQEAAKSQDNLATSLVAVGKALAGLAVVKQIFDAFSASVTAADKMNELAGKTGIAAGKLREYQFAAEQSDTSLEGIIGGLNKLNRSLAASEEETSKQARAFDILGISTTNADGSLKSSEQTFLDLADAFSGLEDGPEKSALAFAVFGQAGKDLLPIMKDGAAGILELRAESELLGQMGPDAFNNYAASSADLFDGIGKLNQIFQGLVNVIAAEVVPVINVVIEGFIESFKSGGLLAQILDGIKVVAIGAFVPAMKAVVVVLRSVADVVSIAGKSLGALGAMIAAVAQGDIAGASQIWSDYKEDIQAVAAANAENTKKTFEASNANVALSDTVEKKVTPNIKNLSKATKEAKVEMSEYTKAVLAFNTVIRDINLDTFLIEYEAGLKMTNMGDSEIKARMEAARIAMARVRAEAEAALADSKKPGSKTKPMSEEQIQSRMNQLLEQAGVLVNARTAAEKSLGEAEAERNILANTYTAIQEETIRNISRADKLRKEGKLSDVEYYKYVDEQQKKLQSALGEVPADIQTANAIIENSYQKVLESVKKNLDIANMLYADGKISVDDWSRYVMEQTKRLSEFNKETTSEITIFWQEAAKNIQSAMADSLFDVMQGKITDIGASFKNMIDRMVANALAANISDALFGKGFGKTGNIGGLVSTGIDWFSTLFAGARASGGPVEAGKAYLVGEKGPEPFIPKVSGTILPNASLAGIGGSSVNQVQVNITAMDSQDVRRALEKDSRWLSDMVRKTGRAYNLG